MRIHKFEILINFVLFTSILLYFTLGIDGFSRDYSNEKNSLTVVVFGEGIFIAAIGITALGSSSKKQKRLEGFMIREIITRGLFIVENIIFPCQVGWTTDLLILGQENQVELFFLGIFSFIFGVAIISFRFCFIENQFTTTRLSYIKDNKAIIYTITILSIIFGIIGKHSIYQTSKFLCSVAIVIIYILILFHLLVFKGIWNTELTTVWMRLYLLIFVSNITNILIKSNVNMRINALIFFVLMILFHQLFMNTIYQFRFINIFLKNSSSSNRIKGAIMMKYLLHKVENKDRLTREENTIFIKYIGLLSLKSDQYKDPNLVENDPLTSANFKSLNQMLNYFLIQKSGDDMNLIRLTLESLSLDILNNLPTILMLLNRYKALAEEYIWVRFEYYLFLKMIEIKLVIHYNFDNMGSKKQVNYIDESNKIVSQFEDILRMQTNASGETSKMDIIKPLKFKRSMSKMIEMLSETIVKLQILFEGIYNQKAHGVRFSSKEIFHFNRELKQGNDRFETYSMELKETYKFPPKYLFLPMYVFYKVIKHDAHKGRWAMREYRKARSTWDVLRARAETLNLDEMDVKAAILKVSINSKNGGGIILDTSPQCEQIIGSPSDGNIIGKSINLLFPEIFRETHSKLILYGKGFSKVLGKKAGFLLKKFDGDITDSEFIIKINPSLKDQITAIVAICPISKLRGFTVLTDEDYNVLEIENNFQEALQMLMPGLEFNNLDLISVRIGQFSELLKLCKELQGYFKDTPLLMNEGSILNLVNLYINHINFLNDNERIYFRVDPDSPYRKVLENIPLTGKIMFHAFQQIKILKFVLSFETSDLYLRSLYNRNRSSQLLDLAKPNIDFSSNNPSAKANLVSITKKIEKHAQTFTSELSLKNPNSLELNDNQFKIDEEVQEAESIGQEMEYLLRGVVENEIKYCEGKFKDMIMNLFTFSSIFSGDGRELSLQKLHSLGELGKKYAKKSVRSPSRIISHIEKIAKLSVYNRLQSKGSDIQVNEAPMQANKITLILKETKKHEIKSMTPIIDEEEVSSIHKQKMDPNYLYLQKHMMDIPDSPAYRKLMKVPISTRVHEHPDTSPNLSPSNGFKSLFPSASPIRSSPRNRYLTTANIPSSDLLRVCQPVTSIKSINPKKDQPKIALHTDSNPIKETNIAEQYHTDSDPMNSDLRLESKAKAHHGEFRPLNSQNGALLLPSGSHLSPNPHHLDRLHSQISVNPNNSKPDGESMDLTVEKQGLEDDDGGSSVYSSKASLGQKGKKVKQAFHHKKIFFQGLHLTGFLLLYIVWFNGLWFTFEKVFFDYEKINGDLFNFQITLGDINFHATFSMNTYVEMLNFERGVHLKLISEEEVVRISNYFPDSMPRVSLDNDAYLSIFNGKTKVNELMQNFMSNKEARDPLILDAVFKKKYEPIVFGSNEGGQNSVPFNDASELFMNTLQALQFLMNHISNANDMSEFFSDERPEYIGARLSGPQLIKFTQYNYFLANQIFDNILNSTLKLGKILRENIDISKKDSYDKNVKILLIISGTVIAINFIIVFYFIQQNQNTLFYICSSYTVLKIPEFQFEFKKLSKAVEALNSDLFDDENRIDKNIKNQLKIVSKTTELQDPLQKISKSKSESKKRILPNPKSKLLNAPNAKPKNLIFENLPSIENNFQFDMEREKIKEKENHKTSMTSNLTRNLKNWIKSDYRYFSVTISIYFNILVLIILGVIYGLILYGNSIAQSNSNLRSIAMYNNEIILVFNHRISMIVLLSPFITPLLEKDSPIFSLNSGILQPTLHEFQNFWMEQKESITKIFENGDESIINVIFDDICSQINKEQEPVLYEYKLRMCESLNTHIAMKGVIQYTIFEEGIFAEYLKTGSELIDRLNIKDLEFGYFHQQHVNWWFESRFISMRIGHKVIFETLFEIFTDSFTKKSNENSQKAIALFNTLRPISIMLVSLPILIFIFLYSKILNREFDIAFYTFEIISPETILTNQFLLMRFKKYFNVLKQ